MTAAPFLVYLALIVALWYVVGLLIARAFERLRHLGGVIARRISGRSKIAKLLSFLPPRILALEPYATLIVLVAVGLGVAFAAGDGFFDLAERLREQSPTLLRVDEFVHDWAQANRIESLGPFFLTFTVLGSPAGLAAILSIGVALALLRRRWSLATFLIVTSGLGGLLNRGMKTFFERQRPDLSLALTDAAHQSFPSGHSMGSVIVLGALAYASLLMVENWQTRALCVSAAVVTSLTMALSRIYLGVHWISDIAAGLTAGLAWLMTSIVVHETYRQLAAEGDDGSA